MFSKSVLTISLLLPLVAISTGVRAGSTITDKSYWPSEVRQSSESRTANPRSEGNSAFAYERATKGGANTNNSVSRWRYHGGPKLPL